MWSKLLTFLPLAQVRQDDDGTPWGSLLPMLIVGILYALVSLLKGKERQKQPPSRRAPQPPAPQKQQAPPAQRRAEAQPQQPSRQPAARPRPAGAARPTPTARRPMQRPARPIPRSTVPPPVGARGPQLRRPVPQGPSRRPVPSPVRQARPPGPVRRGAAVPKPSPSGRAARWQQQTLSSEKAAELRRDRRKERIAHGAPVSAEHRLQMLLHQPDELVRAVLYAEIIGRPLGLRPAGSFETPQ